MSASDSSPQSKPTALPGLEGKFTVCTGTTAGIGLAIAATLAMSGAFTIVNGRSDASCDKAAEKIKELCAPSDVSKLLIKIPGDLSSKDGCAKFVSDVNEALEKAIPGAKAIDVLINNVGIFEAKDFFEYDDERWEEYFQINTMSGVRLSKAFMKPMLERGKDKNGRVIFISSEVAQRPLPLMIPYSVSKASQMNLARGLAELTKGTRVTVNSLLPGPSATEGVTGGFLASFAKEKGLASAEEAGKKYFEDSEPTSLIQRFLSPFEVANATCFLASDLSSGINGHAQRVEGGIVYHV